MEKLIADLMNNYTENYRLTSECEKEIQWKGRINGQYWIIRFNVVVV